jgi:hypothetical protein
MSGRQPRARAAASSELGVQPVFVEYLEDGVLLAVGSLRRTPLLFGTVARPGR